MLERTDPPAGRAGSIRPYKYLSILGNLRLRSITQTKVACSIAKSDAKM